MIRLLQNQVTAICLILKLLICPLGTKFHSLISWYMPKTEKLISNIIWKPYSTSFKRWNVCIMKWLQFQYHIDPNQNKRSALWLAFQTSPTMADLRSSQAFGTAHLCSLLLFYVSQILRWLSPWKTLTNLFRFPGPLKALIWGSLLPPLLHRLGVDLLHLNAWPPPSWLPPLAWGRILFPPQQQQHACWPWHVWELQR